ncbi:MAG: oxidoreductase, partial [Oligoflexia bacterium]|nr:oxidoreductase [Oligoflexia bacterium]
MITDIKTKSIYAPQKAQIVRAIDATMRERHFTLKLTDGKKMAFGPGQILEVSLFGYGEIPIGFASSPTRERTFDIVVRTVGRVSTAINKLEVGDYLFVRGPLGRGLDLNKLRGNNILIVAGGIGLCPTRSFIQYIMDRRSEFKNFTIFYGAQIPSAQIFKDDINIWRKSEAVRYLETVDRVGNDDGEWKGNVGV